MDDRSGSSDTAASLLRLLIRFGIPLAIIGIGWLSYQSADIDKCSGPKASQWVENFEPRIAEANIDMSTVLEPSPAGSDWYWLASRAHTRYVSQQAESPPECLSRLQDWAVEVFYYEWKLFEAIAERRYDEAESNLDKALTAREAALREFDQLAAQYNWDVTAAP